MREAKQYGAKDTLACCKGRPTSKVRKLMRQKAKLKAEQEDDERVVAPVIGNGDKRGQNAKLTEFSTVHVQEI